MQPTDHTPRKVVHVDMDAFYASVEQRDDPNLRGLPVAVGGSRERGVVAAASYEARAFGVRSAMPMVTALRQCPRLVVVPPRFDAYRAVSRQVREVFDAHADAVEPLSLDEAYLDVTEASRRFGTATALARAIRAAILDATALTASAGVSYNKFLAKLASGFRKPDGLTVIAPGRGEDFVTPLDIGRFHGVGPVTEARMRALGVSTGGDLRALSLATLEAEFGKAGPYFYQAARGVDHRPVEADRPRKSKGAETTFPHDLVTLADVVAALDALVDEVFGTCEAASLFGRTVTVKVRFSDFGQVTRSRSLDAPLRDREGFRVVAHQLLDTLVPLRSGVRLLGTSLSGFDEGPSKRPSPQLVLAL